VNIPGGEITIQVAARTAFDTWQEIFRSRNKPINIWDEMGIEAQAAWEQSQIGPCELTAIAVITDFMEWAERQGDFGAALAHAMQRYAADELDYNLIPINPGEFSR
jgi:hypothetical protein